MAILQGGVIELTGEQASAFAFIRDLPSGVRWWQNVKVTE
jgi:hypothetical protein